MNRKKVTMQDVADEIGVSKNTVSRALNDKEGVSEELKEQIKNKALKMGYIIRDKNAKVAVLIKDEYFVESTYYAKILDGIGNKARDYGMQISLIAVDRKSEEGLTLPYPLQKLEVDGIITIGTLEKNFLRLLKQHDYPIVMVDYYTDDVEIDCVVMDNYRGIYLAFKHLRELGHTEIGFIGNIDYFPSFWHRYNKYRMLLIEKDISFKKEICLTSGERPFWDSQYLKEKIKKISNMPTAWICVNDRTAMPLIKVLEELGYKVPEDISVIGFDNVTESHIIHPLLTTIHVDKESLGERGAEKLLWRLKNPKEPVEETFINTKLIIRNSTTLI